MATVFDKLERRFGRYAVPNLTFWLLGGQVLVLLLGLVGVLDVSRLLLQPSLVLQGEWWRLVTFVFIPLGGLQVNLWLLFAFLLLFYCGTAMEGYWGAFRYNCFVLTWLLISLMGAFAAYLLMPAAAAAVAVSGNAFLLSSLFLAFAITHSQTTFYLFFVVPVKVLWLGWITFVLMWIPYLYAGTAMERAGVLAAMLTLLLFFGFGFVSGLKAQRRAQAFVRESRRSEEEPFHRCVVCGATDVSAPDLRFAYKDGKGFCQNHWDRMDDDNDHGEAASR